MGIVLRRIHGPVVETDVAGTPIVVGQHIAEEYEVLVGTEKKTCHMTDSGLMRPVFWGARELQRSKQANMNIQQSIKMLDQIIADTNKVLAKIDAKLKK